MRLSVLFAAAALLTLPFGLPTTRTMDIAPPTAFLLLGKQGPPSEVFFHPREDRTRQFLRHILPEQPGPAFRPR